MQFAVIALLLVAAVLGISNANRECRSAAGYQPVHGACDGPIQRASRKMQEVQIMNGKCPPAKIPYLKDNDPDSPVMCGDCIPGSSGIEDVGFSCKVDEICNDDAQCIPAIASPLYLNSCPVELGGHTKDGWCGPGLRCFQHVCLPCVYGMSDWRTGATCERGQWTTNRWLGVLYDPQLTLLSLVVIILLLWTTCKMLVRQNPDGYYVLGITSLLTWAVNRVQKISKITPETPNVEMEDMEKRSTSEEFLMAQERAVTEEPHYFKRRATEYC